MSVIVLDIAAFAAKLKAGGFTEQQSETQSAPWRKSWKSIQLLEFLRAKFKKGIADTHRAIDQAKTELIS